MSGQYRPGRIVAAIDFSKTSQKALAVATDIAELTGGTLHLVHVIEPIYSAATGLYAPSESIESLRAEELNHAERHLEKLATRARRQLGNVTIQVLEGVPAPAIAEHARRKKADLLVLGTHGRTGLARALLGSVAEKTLRLATCPVLIVPASARTTQPARPNKNEPHRRRAS